MTASATELAKELSQLQQEFRAFTNAPDFSYAALFSPAPGGFVETYRKRTAELQNALSRTPLVRA